MGSFDTQVKLKIDADELLPRTTKLFIFFSFHNKLSATKGFINGVYVINDTYIYNFY